MLYGSIVLEQNSDNQHGGIKLSPAIERTTMLILQCINSAATLCLETMQRILNQELLQVRSGESSGQSENITFLTSDCMSFDFNGSRGDSP